jgi:acyl carrier protein
MPDLERRLISCFATAFPDLDSREIPSAAMGSLASWDSLAVITLIALIEEEFTLSIPPDDVVDLVSFELILEYLQRRHSDANVPAQA